VPLTLAAFVFVLGVLIFVHEAGHFLAAKAAGIQVIRFSLGFGKPLVKVQWGETEYVIAVLPFGGYVKMAGLEDEGVQGEIEGGAATVPIDPARAFDKKPLAPRIVVILAGVTMNVVFAWVVFSVLAGTVGSRRTPITQIDTVLVSQLPPGAAGLATLTRGDRVVAVNGDSIRSWEDLQSAIELGGTPMTVTVAGRARPIVVTALRSAEERIAVIGALSPALPPVVDTVLPGTAAAAAGFRGGDRIVRAGGDTVRSWSQFQRLIRTDARRPVAFQVERDGRLDTLTAVLGARLDTASTGTDSVGYLGVSVRMPEVRKRFTLGPALREGVRQTVAAAKEVGRTLEMLVTRQASIRDLGGPIAIGKVSGMAARAGWAPLFEWMALLSVNLAVLNLLPVPVLDGGQLMFLIAEGVRRRPLSVDLRLRLTQIGFVFILALMLFVVGNDLLRYVIH